ncbi:MAG: hypothetical protein M3O71_21525 [Bacteroidota bacterium]|nr:hypothetical protein [Bacteroidota bacterium]
MLEKLPVKKEYLLIGGAILLLLLSYQLALKKTVEAWQIHRQLTGQLTQGTDLSVQPAYLERKNRNLDKIIGSYKTDTVAFRSTMISTISLLAEREGVKLSTLPMQDPLFHSDKFIIQKLGFEGDFFSLTKVLNRLRLTNGVGMIRSFVYKTPSGRSKETESRQIFLEIYLMSVK